MGLSLEEFMEQITCPKCSDEMDRWKTKSVILDHCNSCKGLWFDEGELTRHFASIGGNISEDDLRADRTTTLLCPRCTSAPLSIGRLASVEVETCEQCHGLFLDLGEVHELLGVVIKASQSEEASTAGFDNFALGLYIGSNLKAD